MKRITQKMLAEAAGLHQTTVSMAMRNHPNVSEETRKRVQALAVEIGYSPDPMLSALANYRSGLQPAGFHGTLGWLARSTPEFTWRKNAHFVRYLSSAKNRAERLGYRIEVMDLGEQKIRWKHAASILKSRGISGVLLCPQNMVDVEITNFPWSDFCGVKFGYSISYPPLQTVAPAQFSAAQRAVSELRLRGYRRIGFIGKRSHNQRTGHNFFGGFLSVQAFEDWDNLISPLWIENGKETEMVRWFEEFQPDAIVTSLDYHYSLLRSFGLEAPKDFGLVCAAIDQSDTVLSGVAEMDERTGEAAVEMLVSMLQRGEKGIPPSYERVLIEGAWREGTTVANKSLDKG